MINMRSCILLSALIAFAFFGCGPALVGSGAAGAFKVATDERSVGQIWDDSAIEARINVALIQSAKVNAANIDVDVVDGVVILNGLVDSFEEAKEAAVIAAKDPHQKGVKNHLMVGTRTFGQIIDDNVIWNKIKGALINEKGVRSLNIDVDVKNGIVFLNGIVENENQRLRIVKIAGSISGVKKVTDSLTLKKEIAAPAD